MGRYDQVIDELRAQRDKIDAAIEALSALGAGVAISAPATATESTASVQDSTSAEIRQATSRVVKRQAAAADPPRQAVRTGRPTSTTHHAILDALRTGPKTTAALIRELSPDITAPKIHGMLNYLGQKTHTIRKNERGEWEVRG